MEAFQILPDPQTNGGLLFSADPSCLPDIINLLKKLNLDEHTQPIGRFTAKREQVVYINP
jgi:selenide,water dikinase